MSSTTCSVGSRKEACHVIERQTKFTIIFVRCQRLLLEKGFMDFIIISDFSRALSIYLVKPKLKFDGSFLELFWVKCSH